MCALPTRSIEEDGVMKIDRSLKLQEYIQYVFANFTCLELINWLTIQTFYAPCIVKSETSILENATNLVGSIWSKPLVVKTRFITDIEEPFNQINLTIKDLDVQVRDKLLLYQSTRQNHTKLRICLSQLVNREIKTLETPDKTEMLGRASDRVSNFQKIMETSVAKSVQRGKELELNHKKVDQSNALKQLQADFAKMVNEIDLILS